MNNQLYLAWSYPAQKLNESRDVLAKSFAPNWQRMTYAIMPLTALLSSHFPDRDLFERVQKLVAASTKRGPFEMNGELYQGSIEHTMRRSQRRTFERLAREIIAILDEIELRRGDCEA